VNSMKNIVFIILVLIILAAIGAVGYFWQQTDILIKADNLSTSTLPPQRAQIQESLPSSVMITPAPNYQKPVDDAMIKFPVFNYHHIRPMPSLASSTITDRAFTVSPEGFEAHLKYFKDNGYQTVSIYDLLNYFDTGKPLPAKAIAITFDDGYYGQYKWAYPLLKKYGMNATFFIIVNNVGKSGILTWGEIKEMSENGMFIGSHTLSHPNLAALSDEILKRELEDSKKIIEEKISKKVDLLAYPGGNYNERVIQFAKDAGYQAALSVYKIIEQTSKARFVIRRFHADDDLESITGKLVGY